jgi:hypothetical protein
MAGISAITGISAGLTSARISTELQVAAIGRAKDAIEFQGEAAIKLIESASVDPEVGQHLDVLA